MKNWKTTLGGIFAGLGTLLMAGDGTYKIIGSILLGLGTLILGIAAKDASKKE